MTTLLEPGVKSKIVVAARPQNKPVILQALGKTMPKLKPGTVMPTPEEDQVINAGIAADPDNPEWTARNFANARPASEVLSQLFGAKRAQEMLKPRGRPRAEHPISQ